MRQRFKNEAIAGRRLRHPNIVPVYEYGEDDDCSYIVMAFVEGRRLKDALDTGPRPSVPEALAITGSSSTPCSMPIARTWCIATSSPPTSWSARTASFRSPISGSKIDLVGLTRTGAVMGTPGYMSPEQCLGTPSDHRADIFAAGVILYQLLTGEQLFQANAALAVMYQVLSVEPVSPSKLNPYVSAALDAVVAKAMAKRREERFQSAREFAEALKEAAKPRLAPAEDMGSMPTITDTVFEPRDQAPPRTPPKILSETAPKTPPNKESVPNLDSGVPALRPDLLHSSPLGEKSGLVMAAIPAVVVVGVVAFLMTNGALRSRSGPLGGADRRSRAAGRDRRLRTQG